jgi:peptidoglycan hydrolase CwlO-like protein
VKLPELFGRRLLILVVMIAATLAVSLAEAGTQSGEGRRKVYWQKRYAMVLSRKAAAESRIEASQKIIRKLRQRDRNQGEERSEATAELESAQKDLAAVDKLLAEFPDTARQAGVPPGWLREVENLLESES